MKNSRIFWIGLILVLQFVMVTNWFSSSATIVGISQFFGMLGFCGIGFMLIASLIFAAQKKAKWSLFLTFFGVVIFVVIVGIISLMSTLAKRNTNTASHRLPDTLERPPADSSKNRNPTR